MKHLIWLRRICQFSVVVAFCLLPWLNINGWHEIKGSLFALDIYGLPFADPASSAQAIAGGIHGDWPLISFYAGGIITLLIAFALGRIFCSWLCPYGLCSELVTMRRRKKIKLIKIKAFKAKTVLTLLFILLASVLALPLITIFSMPGQLSLIPLFIAEGVTAGAVISLVAIPLMALILEFASGERLWCHFACPQSVFLGISASLLPKKAPGLRLRWNPARCNCGNEAPCKESCSLGLNPRKKSGPNRRDCHLCGDCISACAKNGGALSFGVTMPKY